MGDVIKGRLVWQGEGKDRKRTIRWTTRKGTLSKPNRIPDGQLAASLHDATEDEIEVDLELEGGQPRRIRPVGEPWTGPGQEAANQTGGGPAGEQLGYFHNPYNFIPARPRGEKPGELGDRRPTGHDRYYPDKWSGRITVKLTVKTPLLIPDAARAIGRDGEHSTFPIRLGPDDRPYLPPTSVKGMLRSAYEAITNSRMGVFVGHGDRLAYRMPARDGLALVPARIEDGNIVLLMGTNDGGIPVSQGGRWQVPDGLMYAAWLPAYPESRKVQPFPAHGDKVRCWVERIQHWKWDHDTNEHVADFRYWRILDCGGPNGPDGSTPQPSKLPPKNSRGSWHEPLKEVQSITGWACITNRNIDRKHDERVFFATDADPPRIPVTCAHRKAWRELIANYQDEHERELSAGASGPPALQHSVWSRHVTGGRPAQELADGTLCYAMVTGSPDNYTVEALYPVIISRKLFAVPPDALLDASLKPAKRLDELSPADRVFGWVCQDGKGAYRGNLRVGPVHCMTDDAVEEFPDAGLPLAILGAPKPSQARFYVAADQNGKAQEPGMTKEECAYAAGKGLRGRKVYPHHQHLPPDYWDRPTDDPTQIGQSHNEPTYYREYRRPRKDGDEQRDTQNRSILGWVKPGAAFQFDIHLTNLSEVELGALLWLLSLPEDHYLRLGGGKPLGFGSVRLEIVRTELRTGAEWREWYSSLTATAPASDGGNAIEAFQGAVTDAYGNGCAFEEVTFIKAFLRAAKGFDDGLPVHYPRARQEGQKGAVPPHPEGKAYEWFVANERPNDQRAKRTLRDLATDPGLPYLDAHPPG